VRSVAVVVGDIVVDEAAQLVLTEDDDVVEQFAAEGSDEALGDPVLPGAAEAGPDRCDRQGAEGRLNLVLEGVVPVMDQEARRESKGKASRSCWTIQAAFGRLVTLKRTTSRRPCRTMTRA
jgi:hypothetical protein